MGLLDSLMGNASEVNLDELTQELRPVMADDESLALAYKVIRDMLVFTNKRLILIDKQGVTGKKVSYHSVPYKSITHFEVETAGTFDMDAELKIWISGQKDPLIKELKRGTDVVGIQKTIANMSL
ncbi:MULTISPECIES: PH domain-containing protein [Shewanella]|uniref:PH domain-containing protein n=1 Tax=Shewanella fidelis TaxID=173509 RepID=A0AAW8NPH9_9GAMM|nr:MULTISPECIES: PH domain-containing protein [Shewanella]MDR8525062.1 PH domain-containing protein [Shewanella fidelis]MDW4811133.1 PH domain-containing protein [Shewanella fidelis]MDW4815088.1 PH domain-containing protein [Shewanella fidelis]MDW4819178.1 PH domain-containing protein [Shewanella fidelis]MDW4823144.1 PH domain-containing protein [Shewanella fidelis]